MRANRWLATVVLLAMSWSSAHASGDCSVGVVGYWPLDGDGTERVNGLPGTLVGNATFVPGVVGQALDLPGDGSFLDAGTHAVLTDHGGSQMTVAAWIYLEPDGPAGDEHAAAITARTFCNEGNWQLYGDLFGNLYYSKWLNGPEDQVFSSFSTPLETWTHVAATYSANEVRFYVDGALHDVVTPLDFGGAINDFVQNVQIGYDSCSSYWTGSLDEIAVFDVTLSAGEVQELFDKGLAGVGVCEDDADGDGVPDGSDVCPFTEGTALVDGCDCAQILAYKPGRNAGEMRNGCSPGTLEVFARRIGWAKDVPMPPGD